MVAKGMFVVARPRDYDLSRQLPMNVQSGTWKALIVSCAEKACLLTLLVDIFVADGVQMTNHMHATTLKLES